MKGFANKSLPISPASLLEIQNGFGWYAGPVAPFYVTQPLNPALHTVYNGKYTFKHTGAGWTSAGEWCDYDEQVIAGNPAHWSAATLQNRIDRVCMLVDYHTVPNGGVGSPLAFWFSNALFTTPIGFDPLDFEMTLGTNDMREVTGGLGVLLPFASLAEMLTNKVLITIERVTANQKRVTVSAWDRVAGGIMTNIRFLNGAGVGDIPLFGGLYAFNTVVTVNDLQISTDQLIYGMPPAWPTTPL
jgi:hypothetical protein